MFAVFRGKDDVITMELMRRRDIDCVDVIAADKLCRIRIDVAGMISGKPRAKLRIEIRRTHEGKIRVRLDRRDHGCTSHSQTDDADPNCAFRLLHYSPLSVGAR